MINNNVIDIPIIVFAHNERTIDLAILSIKKLGFKNIVILDEEIGFSEKLKLFFELINDEKYKDHDLFIRTDADRICLEGLIDLCKESKKLLEESKDKYLLVEGKGYERFMQRFRGATPHVYSREIMKYCLENKEIIKNVLKPESQIGQYFQRKYSAAKHVNCFTNLHEYNQYPSKMYQAFLTRIKRGHLSYYNVNAILSDEFYSLPMQKALIDSKNNNSQSMDYSLQSIDKDLNLLDEKIGPILNLEEEYNKCIAIANSLKLK